MVRLTSIITTYRVPEMVVDFYMPVLFLREVLHRNQNLKVAQHHYHPSASQAGAMTLFSEPCCWC